MRICDKCGCQSKELTELSPEYDLLEVCEPCRANLEKLIAANWEHCKAIEKKLNRQSFKEWKAKDGGLLSRAKFLSQILYRSVEALVSSGKGEKK